MANRGADVPDCGGTAARRLAPVSARRRLREGPRPSSLPAPEPEGGRPCRGRSGRRAAGPRLSGRPGSGAVRRRRGCRPAGRRRGRVARRPCQVGGPRLCRPSRILDTFATPVVWVLLDEAALHRAVGGPRAMVEQIRHMVRLMEAGRVRVHVMPHRIGAYPSATRHAHTDVVRGPTTGRGLGGASDEQASRLSVYGHPLQAIYDLALSGPLSLTESLALLRGTAEDHGRHG